MSKRVVFINDFRVYNKRYRNLTMKHFREIGYEVLNLGLFDTPFRTIVSALFERHVVSSNMKSNLFLLLFFWRKNVCIINGLGKFKYKKIFRFILIVLFFLNWRTKILFQNYLDYRYFKIYAKNKKFELIYGSGASKRIISSCDNTFVVCRPGKFNYVKEDIYNASRSLNRRFNLVGMELSNEYVNGVGYVPQNKIFAFGSVLFVPSGYGEGIPHVLVDAIFSDCKVLITKQQILSYGLSNMYNIIKIYSNKYLLCKFKDSAKSLVSVTQVNNKILNSLLDSE